MYVISHFVDLNNMPYASRLLIHTYAVVYANWEENYC
jgi:hypothetical protein